MIGKDFYFKSCLPICFAWPARTEGLSSHEKQAEVKRILVCSISLDCQDVGLGLPFTDLQSSNLLY